MADNPIGWFEIYVQDMDRARTFYETVFSTRLERLAGPDIEMWAFASEPERPGAAGALVKMAGFPSGGNSTLVYFTCSDCATEAKRASGSGGKIVKEKFSIGQYGFIALVTDTEGNMIGLHSLR